MIMIIMMMMITLHCLMSRTLFTNIPMSSTPQNRQNLITYCACPRLLRENNANRIQNESEQDRQRRLEVSRQNDALRLNERRQQLQDPQNSRAEYLSN